VGGRIYSRPVERCGMDVFRSFCDRERAEAGKSAKRSPARTRGHLLDCAQRPWRDLPDEFGKWSSVYRQFIRCSRAGLRTSCSKPRRKPRLFSDALQMIRFDHCAGAPSHRWRKRGDLEKHSWPFVRWLLDQNSPPHKRRRPANWHHDHGG
jgi:hypothetical protein